MASSPGPYTFTVDGLDGDDRPLPSGTYTLLVGSYYQPESPTPPPGVDDRIITGETSTTLRIDLDAPRVADTAATPQVFHPDQGDLVSLTGELSEPASRFRVRLLRDGSVVRRLWLGPQPAGTFTASWDGRRPNGNDIRAGTYRYELFAKDRVGNTAIRHGRTFELRASR